MASLSRLSHNNGKRTLCGEPLIGMALCWICGSQSRRNTNAAKQFFRTLLTGWPDVPRAISTDKLASSAAAKLEILPGVEHPNTWA